MGFDFKSMLANDDWIERRKKMLRIVDDSMFAVDVWWENDGEEREREKKKNGRKKISMKSFWWIYQHDNRCGP